MKDIATLYNEVLGNDELKTAFATAVQEKKLDAFLKNNGCEASADDVKKFLEEQQAKEGEISDAELGSASGGCSTKEGLLSVVTAGVYCLVDTALSIDGGALGDTDSGKLLCPYM